MPDDDELDYDEIHDDTDELLSDELEDVDVDPNLPMRHEDLPKGGREPGFKMSDVAVRKMRLEQNKKAKERYAGQLSTIDLAAAVSDELAPLTAPNARGVLLDTALVKLAVDILAGNVKPRNLREATSAMESIAKVMQMTGLEEGNRAVKDKDERSQLYADIRIALTESRGVTQMDRSAAKAMDVIEASYTEDES